MAVNVPDLEGVPEGVNDDVPDLEGVPEGVNVGVFDGDLEGVFDGVPVNVPDLEGVNDDVGVIVTEGVGVDVRVVVDEYVWIEDNDILADELCKGDKLCKADSDTDLVSLSVISAVFDTLYIELRVEEYVYWFEPLAIGLNDEELLSETIGLWLTDGNAELLSDFIGLNDEELLSDTIGLWLTEYDEYGEDEGNTVRDSVLNDVYVWYKLVVEIYDCWAEYVIVINEDLVKDRFELIEFKPLLLLEL